MNAQRPQLHELAADISHFQNLLLSLPRSHPLRVYYVQSLAIARFERYEILGDSEDLNQSILSLAEAIFLPLPWDRRCQNILQTFLFLTHALVLRAMESRRPEDVTRSIIYLRYLRGQPLEAFNVPPSIFHAATALVITLEIQVEMKLGDVRQDVEEMADVLHDLLKSDVPTTSVTGVIMALPKAVFVHLTGPRRREYSDKVIECLRMANVRLPDSHDVSVALAWSLRYRFDTTCSSDDCEEAITILDKVIRAPEHKLSEAAKLLAAKITLVRSRKYHKPEHLEEAIYRTRMVDGTGIHPAYWDLLGILHAKRFSSSDAEGTLQEIRLRNPGVFDRPSFQDLTASLTESNADNKDKHFYAMLSLLRITDGAEIEEAIKYCRLLLASHYGASDALARMASSTLYQLLHRAFSCTKKIEYLNELISLCELKLEGTNNQGLVRADPSSACGLHSYLFIRFGLLHRKKDFNRIMQLSPMVANDERAATPTRFRVSYYWASLARLFGHPSTSVAYDRAISLMQDTLTFFPTLEIQHSQLAAIYDSYGNLPLDHASFHIYNGQLRRAIETLERGRALIWSEMRGLRTSIDQIRAKDRQLAVKFAAVNRDLEVLTLNIQANSNVDGQGGSSVGMDPYGRLVMQQRKLLDDRNELILQIQALPGFGTFLKPPSFDRLHYAAARGPVIIINHCKWRSDIIILLHNSPQSPSLIPTADDFYDRANKLRDRLLGARKTEGGLESNQYENALRSVLRDLYELVGRPVIQRLNELSVPEQSRVWWCPTSVFFSLPLHAMGPIPSDDGPRRYFLDLYIPSYTTTLSTLVESNIPGSHTLDKPSILLVSQPDLSLPNAIGETQVVKATNTRVTTLISAKATPTTVLEGLRDHRFAHFACHGTLEAGKPFDASFRLYGNKRLSLHDIVRSRLPEAEFAFLLACHTAELTEESIAEEALHLAAAMQYCGFRSVVGTMWAMVDEDGPELARKFYKRVFSERREEQGVRYYERTAEALRDAVKSLRGKKRMTLERWVNFVHYGA